MTYAPARLLEVRRYLKPITGLSDIELGIAPDENHVGGYHCGWDQRRLSGDYSWSESTRDSSHKTNAARAFDLGWFDRLIDGKRINLIAFNLWFVGQLQAGAPDTRDVREFIYTPDGKTVKRWDRLGKRTTGDSSHLGHSHISYFADAEDRDKTSPFRRFFGGDDMDASDVKDVWQHYLAPAGPKGPGYNLQDHLLHAEQRAEDAAVAAQQANAKADALLSAVAAISAKVGSDPAELDALKQAAEQGARAGVLAAGPDLALAVAAELSDELGLSAEEAQAASERAVRRVLGQLDQQATP